MTVKIETIEKKVNELKKMHIDENDIAFGQIANSHSEYHDRILKIRRELNSFSRDLIRAENQYVKRAADKDMHNILNAYVEKYMSENNGNMALAISQIQEKLGLDQPKETNVENYTENSEQRPNNY